MALLRPATVLSILLFIAFACLLVSVLTTPIIKSLALASTDKVSFGVFGYCTSIDNVCSGIRLGYDVGHLTAPGDFSLPSNARLTLTNLLVIHPIAALLVLILLILTIASHFYSPGHSPGYLLFMVYFSIFTCVVAVVTFLVDILLFVPHLAAGGYIVVGAPICLAIVVIGLCARRRRVVGKQDRKRRIAESAPAINPVDTNTTQDPSFRAPGGQDGGSFQSDPGADKLPEFASFEVGRQQISDGPGIDETGERIPLNPRQQSPPIAMGSKNSQSEFGQGRYGQMNPNPGSSNYPNDPRTRNAPNQRGGGGPLPPNHRLPLNNPGPAFGGGVFGTGPMAPPYGPPRNSPGPNGPRMQNEYRDGNNPNPQLGYYNDPRGPGMLPPQQDYPVGGGVGGLQNAGGFAGPLNPPPEVSIYALGRPSPPPRGASPALYGPGQRRGPSPQQAAGGYYSAGPPSANQDPRFQDNRGKPQQERAWAGQPGPPGQSGPQQLGVIDYTSDEDSRGQPSREGMFIGTALAPGPGRVIEAVGGAGLQERNPRDTLSYYGTDDGTGYVPPRAQWQQNEGASSGPVELAAENTTSDNAPQGRNQETAAINQNTVELPGNSSDIPLPASTNRTQQSENYYEDVDPRFAGDAAPQTDVVPMPASLMAGYGRPGPPPPQHGNPSAPYNRPQYAPGPGNSNAPGPPNRGLPQADGGYGNMRPPASYPYNDTQGPPISPSLSVMSEQTNFTSISQRPVNPRWQGNGGPPGPPMPQARPQQRNVLAGNPDFELPSLAQGRGGGRGAGGRLPGSLNLQGLGSDRGGRYPQPPPSMGR
ncbi:SUR7/PalI family-domain-containing protein [Peziza echinospora]|nr:SUR7/PalI family-domain-containing protein [Peziza echinospora]